jgi:hypothetical protein
MLAPWHFMEFLRQLSNHLGSKPDAQPKPLRQLRGYYPVSGQHRLSLQHPLTANSTRSENVIAITKTPG